MLAIIRKPVKIVEHHRVCINDPPATRASTTHTSFQHLAGPEIRDPSPDRRRRNPGRADNRLRPAIPQRDRLRRRPQPPRALIQMHSKKPKPLPHITLVNHAHQFAARPDPSSQIKR